MKKRPFSNIALDALTLPIALVLFIGSFTFLKTCPAMEDGSWMACHWAGQAISGVSAVIAALSIANIFVTDKGFKAGISLGIALNAILNAFVPGKLINTCMMPDMQCNAVTKPAVAVISGVLAVLAIINVLVSLKGKKKESK